MISRAFGAFASREHNAFCQRLINTSYAKLMKLDLSEFAPADSYPSLTALFTRALGKPREFDADKSSVIAPADSFVTECGVVEDGKLLQIKGMSYSLAELLPHIDDLSVYNGKTYINYYLSPSDYHRYHLPIDLELTTLTHIPGKLYPVNIPFLRKKPSLFVENERAILAGKDSDGDLWQLVFVGALNVGKMRFTHIAGFNTNIKTATQTTFTINEMATKGELLGWFEMGSTVVVIAPKKLRLADGLQNKKVRFGESVAWIEK